MSRVVLSHNFSIDNWIDYFENCSIVFEEKQNHYSIFNDELFCNSMSIGKLAFEDGSSCHVFMIKVQKPLSERSCRRKQFNKATQIIKELSIQAGLYIFYDDDCSFRFSLVYPVYKGSQRKFSNYRRHSFFVSDSLSNKTYFQQLSKFKLNSMKDLKDAFSVDKVSDLFYKEFKEEYDQLQHCIFKKDGNEPNDDLKADFALLFVIRIIFLGFVQKKGWLGNSPNFLTDYIASYDPNLQRKGLYQDLLLPLFFTALNTAPHNKNENAFSTISEPYKTFLVKAPYLNGGLFRKHENCDLDGLYITDDAIKRFISFLFSFNFTLEENTLYDEELELNPEFLGIIFEKLVNKADGAIYTPRLEVDFMCRLSLVKYLQQNCPKSITLENLYKLFFPEYGDESEQTCGEFTPEEAIDLLEKLESVTVCDPAIGSGAFAVGMLNVLDEIECSIHHNFLSERPLSNPYERKKRIIFKSLYGVEVKQWAVWISQLRLWITLLIEADDSCKDSVEPLLPSFDFKIRQGDSLIQMIGSEMFPVSGEGIIAADTRKKIADLVKLKKEYYYNKCPNKLHDIEQSHKALFTSILDKKKRELLIKLTRYKAESTKEVQANLFNPEIQGEIDFTGKQQIRDIEELEFQINKIDFEISQISAKNLPFIWRIDFPEIFIEKGGFDIVIGNPPYVQQEGIGDPLGKIVENTKYKELLRVMANQDFSQDIPINVISGKSDLYTFFYIRGLRLLNKTGILTYICSNSWLDVEFGAWLQKFFLDKCKIYFIIDNLANRVFREAGINTIITLISVRQKMVRADDMIRFTAFKIPFENSLYTENFITIEEATSRIEYDDLRVNPISRERLLQEGWENSKENKYQGFKWGGIYIKAPDIYFTIMEKAKSKLVKLGEIAEIKFGVKTGADEFFYIPKTNPHNIEPEFLKPVIKSPRECKSIMINPDNLSLWLFVCPYEKHELKGTNALKYIEMGESARKYIKQGKDKGKYIVGIQNVSTIQNRNPWWTINQDLIASIFIQMTFSETFKFFFSHEPIFGDNRLYCISSEVKNLQFLLNSSLSFLLIELIGRSNLGEGALDMKVYEAERILVPNPELFSTFDFSIFNEFLKRPINSIFHELQVDPESGSFKNANPLPDRKALDEVVFRALGLTYKEIKALYAGLLELTANRLRKARTFTN